MTFQAVADGAGVSKRSVFRHFANERELHAEVMQRLQERAGVTYEDLDLDDIVVVARRVFEALSSLSVSSFVAEPEDPAFTSMDRARGNALRNAVAAATPKWSPKHQALAAGVLDVLWSPASYERLVAHWGASPDDAIEAIQWAIGLVVHNLKTSGPDPRHTQWRRLTSQIQLKTAVRLRQLDPDPLREDPIRQVLRPCAHRAPARRPSVDRIRK